MIMSFEWDLGKSATNNEKHGIDFVTAELLWLDDNRVEIQASYPLEDRWILIGKIDLKLWTAVITLRGDSIRIISVRRSRKKEVDLYEKKSIRKK